MQNKYNREVADVIDNMDILPDIEACYCFFPSAECNKSEDTHPVPATAGERVQIPSSKEQIR